MKENKAFKDFRKALNESEYSEVLTGYGNRSAHKDDAGLHHLQSAGALAGINAMLATIGKGTYLDPNEAFLKMKVRLNVVQLDFAWKPGSWDGGVGSFDIPVVQFGRVDGYDAQTGQIRFDGKANPTGGYTELNLHVDVELTPESLYVVSAKLTPSVPVAEEVEVAEGWKSLKKTKADLNAIRASGKKVSVQHGEGDTLYRVSKAKKAVKEEAELEEDIQTSERAAEMRTKIGTAVKQTASAKDKLRYGKKSPHDPVKDRNYRAFKTAQGKRERVIAKDTAERASQKTYGVGGKVVKEDAVAEDYQTPAREKEMERKVQKHEDIAQRGYSARMTKTGKAAKRGEKLETKHDAASLRLLKRSQKEADSPRTYGRGGKIVKRGSRAEVKEEIEQIDEAGQAKLERLGKAYDKARLGSRGVLNPENKKKLGDAYFKMREKVLDKRKKRIEKGTFDKEKEVQARVAHNKKNYGKGVFGHVFGKKTVKEELVGGQKKLDVNKNKRLDAQDFALLRAKKKKPVTEAKMKYWVPRLDKLFNNRDVVRSRPKKSILTQKVQNGKKVGSPRPIAKYEGK